MRQRQGDFISSCHFNNFLIFIKKMKGKFTLLLLAVWVGSWLSNCQFSPLWQASPYIQCKNLVIVSNGQKVTGTYTLPITFATTFSAVPNIALAMPQLRLINGNTLAFKQYHSSLSSTGFTHNLNISDSTTIIYYMVCRYAVFDATVLANEFQTYYKSDKTGAASVIVGSENFNVVLTPNAISANSPVCMAFLSGVTAASNSSYQLNLTCSITSTSATVTATAYPSTFVYLMSFYLVVWDPVILAVQSYLFVDYAVTTTYYNAQSSPLTLPYGYLDKGYCGGMASFSTTSLQELNFTLSSLNLTTTQTSLFDSAPQFQVRVRNCSSSFSPFYNKADGLCYPVCPGYTYSVAGAFLCASCPSYCVICLNGTVCTNCSTGMSVVNNSCSCSSTTYLSGGVCIGCHYSCLTCVATGQYYNCLTCNASNYRSLSTISGSNMQCGCNDGYTDGGTAVCVEICGDGNARTDACDDNNTISGDGCSSTCVNQTNFVCSKNSTTNFSSCYYTGSVTISEVKIFKSDYQNTFKVYFQVSPWIDSMALLANSVSLTTNMSIVTPIGYSVEQGLLVMTMSYQEEIMDSYMMVYLKPTSSGIFSRLPPANCTFQLKSDNGFELRMYTNLQYQVAGSFHYIAMVLGYLILASAFLFIFGRLKWMGNLLFFSLQFQYLSMAIVPRFTPMLSGLSQIKTVMGYNEIFGQEEFDLPRYTSLAVLNFNKQYDYNVNVMVAIQGLALLMYLFYHVTYRKNELLCKKYGGDPEKSYRALKYGKILQFFDWEFFMFWAMFNMVNQITAMILFSELPQLMFLPLIAFNALCILLGIAPLLVRRKQVKSYTVLLYCADRGHEQSLVSLTCYILMFALLGVSLTTSKVIYYLLFLFPITMMIYICCRRPFQSKWMRAAYFVNCFCIFISLIYNLLTIAFEDTVYYLPFGSLITILLDWIFNLVVWGREAYVICKYGGERDLNQILASNTKNSSNDQNNQDFFKDTMQRNQANNQPFLNSVIKQQTKTKRPLRRGEELDDDTPTGIKEQRQAKLDEEEQQQRKDLKKRRQNWMRQMKDMKESRNIRERTRYEIEGRTLVKSPAKSKIRSTGQPGIDQSQLQSVL